MSFVTGFRLEFFARDHMAMGLPSGGVKRSKLFSDFDAAATGRAVNGARYIAALQNSRIHVSIWPIDVFLARETP